MYFELLRVIQIAPKSWDTELRLGVSGTYYLVSDPEPHPRDTRLRVALTNMISCGRTLELNSYYIERYFYFFLEILT